MACINPVGLISFIVYVAIPILAILASVVYVLASKEKFSESSSLFVLAIASFFGVIYGHRSLAIGIDYAGYVDFYYSIVNPNYIYYNIEPGYVYLNRLFSKAHVSHVFFFGGIFAITTGLMLRSVEKAILPALVFVLVCMGFLLDASNIVRHTLVFSIFIAAIKIARKKKIWHFMGIVVASSLIHKSAIFLSVIYFVIHRDLFANRFKLLMALVVLFIAGSFFFRIEYLSTLLDFAGYGKYLRDAQRLEELTGASGNRKIGLGFLFVTVIDFVMIFFYSRDLKKFSPRFLSFYNLHVIGLGFSFFSAGTILLTRINYYFLSFRFFTIAYLLYFLYRRRKGFDLIYLVFIILIYLLAYYNRVMEKDSQYFPFEFINN